MSRPAIFADMADAFVGGFGNVTATIALKTGAVTVAGILRKVRQADLLDIEGMGLEGISYSFSCSAVSVETIRQQDVLTIVSSDDGQLIGKSFIVSAHVDDGRAMKRLLLHEDE